MKRRAHKNEVTLSEEQRNALHRLISSGKAPARKLAHARMLLNIDRNTLGNAWSDEQVAEAFEVSRSTVMRIRERFVEHGLDEALNHRHAPQTRSRVRDGEQEAHLIALACSPCPNGHARWTFRLLAERLVELEYTEQVSYETVRRVLKKRTQAVVKAGLVHSASCQRTIRLSSGRCAGGLYAPLRCAFSPGV